MNLVKKAEVKYNVDKKKGVLVKTITDMVQEFSYEETKAWQDQMKQSLERLKEQQKQTENRIKGTEKALTVLSAVPWEDLKPKEVKPNATKSKPSVNIRKNKPQQ